MTTPIPNPDDRHDLDDAEVVDLDILRKRRTGTPLPVPDSAPEPAEVADAETVAVEPDALGAPVDPPVERRTVFAAVSDTATARRKPVVPGWVRSAQARTQFLRWTLDYAGYVAAFHTVRAPLYAGKAAVWAPVGAARTFSRAMRWATAEEGNWTLRQEAANRNQPDIWLQLDKQRQRQAKWRWPLLLASALGLTIGVALLLTVAPWWWKWFALAAIVPVLARFGRPVDKPILDRVSTGQRFTRLTADMVRAALCSLGIAGIKDPAAVTFPAPGIHRDGPGWLARVNLPQGVEAVDVLERRGRLSSALRLPVDQVWPSTGPDHAGQLDLWVGYQPASKMGQPAWSLAAPSARTSFFEAAEFGTDQRQRPVKTVLNARNYLIGGVPGSGKSYGARTLAVIAALDPTVELKIVEYKGTADFGDLAPLCSTYACGVDDEAFQTGRDMLAWGLAEARRRGERIRRFRDRGLAPEGKVTPELARTPGSGLHPIVIVIDEAHELFGDATHGKDAAADAERLIKRGRALAMTIVLATQIPDRDSLPTGITRCVTMRWCMAVQDHVANDMILGTGAYKRGLAATVYRPGADAGWGILTGLAEPTPVRSHFPDPKTNAAIVARATALRGRAVVGEAVDEQQRRDILADVLATLGTGERGAHWEVIADRLADLDEAYRGVTAEVVSARLRAERIDSVDVKMRGDRSPRKGARRTDIAAAIDRREANSTGRG